ncbi:Amine oxidase [Ophiocordyceps camponoti-floridani]|uniref:Amine oxidase n=1 Tax=Ophiocordyceps camponoti-floridani TaxID=2030778 RepID=A0A8H4QCB4_9HYPO|nr:Amine oxidase [Ophiocordyceps camponoti-floridani]
MAESSEGDDDNITVAVIGTGLAGLTAAHLLQNDHQHRYRVTLFDKAKNLSLDSASVTVRHAETARVERVDLPMRACAGGYYENLLRMCRHLAIPLHPVRFLFAFAAMLPTGHSWRCEATGPGDVGSAPGTYFVYASNMHRALPPRPAGRRLVSYWVEVLYLVVCQAWFIAVCFLVRPKTRPVAETLGQYLDRTRVPRRFSRQYLLPLMSSVSTCSHAEMLAFPASDVVDYKRLSHGRQHYAVCGGVWRVQSRLAEGVRNVRLGCQVTSVEVDRGRLLVHWHSTAEDGSPSAKDEVFDRVILAVSPDMAAAVFRPLSDVLGKMPTKRVESSVLNRWPGTITVVADDGASTAPCSFRHGDGCDAQPPHVVTLRTRFAGTASATEAFHALPSGVLVHTCPLDSTTEPAETVLRKASFTRTLRTAESKAVVESIFGRVPERGWKNGQDNVWLVGSWCWDGMVLLEGCVVSALRVARDFDVGVSWGDAGALQR